MQRMLRAQVDPSSPDLRAEPQNEHDLIIAATNNWVLSLDNLSRIRPWLSDALCRLATGGGHATRQLYTDSEEALFDVRRPVMLNGIGELATRSDLLSRIVVIEVPPIPSNQRRPERELWLEFEAARPRILGALLDAVATGLQRLPTTRLTHHPRMADFAVWVSAAEPSLGWDEGTFLKAYEQNQASANELALEASPITAPLFALLAKGCFEGTMKSLLASLVKHADEATTKQRGWPRSERALRAILDRLTPNFRAVGVEFSCYRRSDHGRDRTMRIHFSKPSGPSGPSDETSIEEPLAGDLPLQQADQSTLRLDDIADELLDIIYKSKKEGDNRSAVAGARELIRIKETERKLRGDSNGQSLPPAPHPLPGAQAGRPLTESEKQARAQIENFSPADRMAMREGFTAAVRLAELARRPPEPDDE